MDQKLKPFQKTEMVLIPNNGGINTILTTLNMTMAQLGTRLKITRQGVRSIEESETKGSISINSLKEVGMALDLKFVYGFVPKDGQTSLDEEEKERVKIKSITTEGELNEFAQLNIEKAIE